MHGYHTIHESLQDINIAHTLTLCISTAIQPSIPNTNSRKYLPSFPVLVCSLHIPTVDLLCPPPPPHSQAIQCSHSRAGQKRDLVNTDMNKISVLKTQQKIINNIRTQNDNNVHILKYPPTLPSPNHHKLYSWQGAKQKHKLAFSYFFMQQDHVHCCLRNSMCTKSTVQKTSHCTSCIVKQKKQKKAQTQKT